MLPVQDLAYMAGVLDLKGRVILKKNSTRRTQQRVLAVQTQEMGVVRKLSSMTGTNPELMKSRPVKDFMRKSCELHCPEEHVHVHMLYPEGVLPPSARWTITGAGMVVVLLNVMPFIQIDRDYQDVIEDTIRDTPLEGQGIGMVVNSLARLKALGWDIPERYNEVLIAQPGRAEAS